MMSYLGNITLKLDENADASSFIFPFHIQALVSVKPFI